MGLSSLAVALIDAETNYLEAMLRHEVEQSDESYDAMASAAHKLDTLEAVERWWEESRSEEAANATPLMALQQWRGAPR
ncbi:MAG: hypothetical protein HY903_24535 [Deltaproteobacteria bacterium]|nr:hypothetical protein [Deltaproteobacteria bacterium]